MSAATTTGITDRELASPVVIAKLAHAFERIELPPQELGHRVRLALGAWYLMEREESEAVRLMLGTLSRYQMVNTNLPGELRYHETRVLFWLGLTRAVLDAVGTTDRAAALRAVLARCGDRADLIHQYYSAELFNSWRAIYGWVEPDRRPMVGAI